MISKHAELNYLSWSGFNLYKRSPQLYFEAYVLGIKPEPSKAMCYGSVFSQAFADRKFNYVQALKDLDIKQKQIDFMKRALFVIPDIGKKNCEVEVRVKNEGLDLLGIYDGYLKTGWQIIENKTGAFRWGQIDVDCNEQLSFYALIHWLKFKVVPRKITLIHLNTVNGSLKQFNTKRTVRQVKDFKKQVDYTISSILAEKWE